MTAQRLLGAFICTSLILFAGSASAREGQRPRVDRAQRATQPHTRTTEHQRTENGRTRKDTWTNDEGRMATRDAVVTRDEDAGTRTRNVDYTGPNGNTASVDSVRTKTDEGFTRSTTATNAQGETATRDLAVTRDKESDTVTRNASYTTLSGGAGTKTDVIQRTEDGYTRDVTRTTPDGSTHTRAVDFSCDKDAAKCVKQVEVGKEP